MLKKTVLWILRILLFIVVAVPIAIYIPPVQNFAKNFALKKVKESTGMDISINFLRLKFPLKVSLQGVRVIEASGDTMATLGNADVAVKLLPLFKGNVEAGGIDIEQLTYNMGTPDSVICLKAEVDKFTLDGGEMQLKNNRIELGSALLDGGRVTLLLKDTVTPEKTDTTASKPLFIKAQKIEIKNLEYRMAMLPTIDSLYTYLPRVELRNGEIDLGKNRVDADLLQADSLTASLFTPPADYKPKERAELPDTTVKKPSAPMLINIKRIELNGKELTYAMKGAKPTPGFDMDYIAVNNVDVEIDSLRNYGVEISVPLRRLEGTERCGLKLSANGNFNMDSTQMQLEDFDLEIGNSMLRANAAMGMGDLSKNPNLPIMLKADGRIEIADVETAFPSMSKTLRGLPRRPIALHADVQGTTGKLNINDISIDWPGYLFIEADGAVANPTDFAKMNGRINIDGNLRDVNPFKPTLLGAAMAKQLNVPPTRIKGFVNYSPNLIDGDIKVVSGGGDVQLAGKWIGRVQGYNANLQVNDFPVANFMPSLGIGNVSATAKVNGQGFNMFSPKTYADADIVIKNILLNGKNYSDISLTAKLKDGEANGRLESRNPGADLDLDFIATISKGTAQWDLTGSINELNLKEMGFSEDTMGGKFNLTSQGTYNEKSKSIDATLDLNNLWWKMGDNLISALSIDTDFRTNDSITSIELKSGDLDLTAQAYCPLDTLLKKVSAIEPFINRQIAHKEVDVVGLQHLIPPMDLRLNAGASNFASNYLRETSDISFSRLNVSLHNDSLINFKTELNNIVSGNTRVDNLTLNLNQVNKFLVYDLTMNNKPGTMDDFAHVVLKGIVSEHRLSLLVNQHNIKNEQGFFFGFTASMTDSIANIKLVPFAPTIAYQKWRVNPDNEITFNFKEKHLDANLQLNNAESYLRIFTEHNDSTSHGNEQEDVIVQLSQIKLQDWLSISPFAPPIKGDLGANLRFRWNKEYVTGKGNVSLNEFYYGRDRVGSFDLGLDVSTSKSGALNADVALMVDSVKVITAKGALNDTTLQNPFLLDFSMIRFPLAVANPFIPKDVAQLRGTLNGNMKITGSLKEPQFNGFIDFDSTAVKVAMTGAEYAFSEAKIPVDSNIVKFNNFEIIGLNHNNLAVNGTVDVRRLSNIAIDLGMHGENMQIVNSSRPKGANLYGKAYIDLDAKAKGNMNFLKVTADLNILPETNITYLMTSAQNTIQNRSTGDMVTFMQFSDTTNIANDSLTQSMGMALMLDAQLTVSEGSTINVDLSTDGKNKAQIKGMGTLDFSMNPMNSGRLTGRFTINSGFVRYSPPLMSELNFNIEEGSYAAFTGDMLNPTLHLKAVEQKKANVTQEGQNSRLINFLIELSVGGTLQNMNVAFNLATNDDLTISNELQGMSAEQRANQAMNLLLYNTYTGPGTKASSSLGGNPLFTFLEGQINSWAANNIRGVDISFGIDQYDKTVDGASETTTSYSYRVSKSLFNNRFKIVVGGNYSTDANADENFSQNLINDISFEYMLNRSGSMFIKLFRHVGYESILEGEVTQTGVGFVYRQKLNSLWDLFRWNRKKKETEPKEGAINK